MSSPNGMSLDALRWIRVDGPDWFTASQDDVYHVMRAHGAREELARSIEHQGDWCVRVGLGERHPGSGVVFVHPETLYLLRRLCTYAEAETTRYFGMALSREARTKVQQAALQLQHFVVLANHTRKTDPDFVTALDVVMTESDIFGVVSFIGSFTPSARP